MRNKREPTIEYPYGNKRSLKKPFLDVLSDIGILTVSARKVGLSKSTLYRWLAEDEAFEEGVQMAIEEAYKKNKQQMDEIPEKKRSSYFNIIAEV